MFFVPCKSSDEEDVKYKIPVGKNELARQMFLVVLTRLHGNAATYCTWKKRNGRIYGDKCNSCCSLVNWIEQEIQYRFHNTKLLPIHVFQSQFYLQELETFLVAVLVLCFLFKALQNGKLLLL